MARRILLDENGLKVSKRGVDVLTAKAGQLNFSSDWAGMNIYQRGTVTYSWSKKGDGKHGEFSRTVMLGKTFPTIPFVMFYWQFAGAYVPAGYGNGFSITQDRREEFPSSVWAAVGQVSTDRIVFGGNFTKKFSTVGDPSVTIQFLVFDHNF